VHSTFFEAERILGFFLCELGFKSNLIGEKKTSKEAQKGISSCLRVVVGLSREYHRERKKSHEYDDVLDE